MLFFPALISLGVSSRASYDPNVFLYSVVISTIGLFSYLCAYGGYFLPRRKVYNYNHDFNRIGLSKFLESNKFRIWFVIFSLGLLLLNAVLPFWLFVPYINSGLVAILLMSFSLKKPTSEYQGKFLLIFLLVIVLIMSINQTGGRRDILAIFIIWGYIFFNFFRPSSNKDILWALSGVFLLFVSLLVVTINRSFDLTEGGYFHYAYRMYITYEGFIGSLLVMADFGVGYDNFLSIIKNTATDGFLGIQSFYKIFLSIIPRQILFDKPIDVQTLIIERGYANYNFAGGTSQSTTLIGELYWNLGLFTVALGMYFFGLIMKFLDAMLIKKNLYSVLISISLIPNSFVVWRGAFSSSVIYSFAIVVLIWLFLETVKNLNLQKIKY